MEPTPTISYTGDHEQMPISRLERDNLGNEFWAVLSGAMAPGDLSREPFNERSSMRLRDLSF